MTYDYDVVIIGAGMSGLAAGIRLAHFDKRVCVLDRHYLWGGLNSFYRLGGYRFDVGLHAMTNYVLPEKRSAPLMRLLRQLRFRHEEFALTPQRMSRVMFPGRTLHFNNDFALFVQEVADNFPAQIDGFNRLVAHIESYQALDLDAAPVSARKVLEQFLDDPLLIEMLFCPLMFYGSADENDMQFGQFVVMFQSIFLEGFARPFRGVRHILELITARYKKLGGQLRMKTGVKRLQVDGDRVVALELDSGEQITARRVISSAGLVETLRLCSDWSEDGRPQPAVGQLTFVESISVLDCQPDELGYDTTITFFNNSPTFHYERSTEPLDVRSGVICSPNNFLYDEPLPDALMRVTSIANYDHWTGFDDEADYQASKQAWYEKSLAQAVQYSVDFREHVTFTDVFTPRTIQKFTGHLRGAVYGSPDKVKTGQTHLDNLFICGTDQGFLGIIGAMLSGITIANLHVLRAD